MTVTLTGWRCTFLNQRRLYCGTFSTWKFLLMQNRMSTSSNMNPVAAVCQMTSTADKETNFSVCKRLVEAAREGGAGMVFLPEAFDYIGSCRDETLALAESLTGDTISRYTQLARLHRGSVQEVGLGICYDLRFPELSLALQRQGADILTYPSAFTVATGAAHWEVLLRARAVETQCYVLAAAQVGRHNTARSSWGHALAVDPWGAVVADCGGEEVGGSGSGGGMVLVEVDLEKVRETRRNMPVQQHCRDAGFYRSLENAGDTT
ncbi:hypothetical protein CRUP_035831 [Coryphaenoides rupestris]|nr:hypothetical protein CRUP_035831 [Coryphaenoides rupestris]